MSEFTKSQLQNAKNFYIASKLENVAQVIELRDILLSKGWRHTYDWTTHGSVRGETSDVSIARIAEVAHAELRGVEQAEVLIVLLPGGRGTHVELGIGLAGGAQIWLWSANPALDFGITEATSTFYHIDNLEHCSGTMEELAELLVNENRWFV